MRTSSFFSLPLPLLPLPRPSSPPPPPIQVDAGASTKAKDRWGKTALMIASERIGNAPVFDNDTVSSVPGGTDQKKPNDVPPLPAMSIVAILKAAASNPDTPRDLRRKQVQALTHSVAQLEAEQAKAEGAVGRLEKEEKELKKTLLEGRNKGGRPGGRRGGHRGGRQGGH